MKLLSPLRRTALLTLSLIPCALQVASAQTVLFTTQNDFSSWGNNGDTNVGLSVSALDSDGSSINGLGNTSSPGGADTAGSLFVTQYGGTYNFFYSPGEQGNAAFLAVLGSSGTLSFDYTVPVNNGGSYFQLGLVLNYTANFVQFFGGAPTDLGTGWFRQTVSYTVANQPGPYSYFQLGLIFNSNYDTTAPATFYVDNIQVVPEPGMGTLAGLGLMGWLAMRRRRS